MPKRNTDPNKVSKPKQPRKSAPLKIAHAPEPPAADNTTTGIVERMRQISSQGNAFATKGVKLGRKPKLQQIFESGQEQVYAEMLMLIRGGCYDHVAASCLGIDPLTFTRWKTRGSQSKGGVYRQFYLDVTQAAAQARSLAEIEIKKTDPAVWLRVGPGRSKQGLDGWTETINIGGNPDSPLSIDHKHSGRVDIQHAHAHLVIDKNVREGECLLAEALAYAEEAGLLTRTESGAKMFLRPSDTAASDAPIPVGVSEADFMQREAEKD